MGRFHIQCQNCGCNRPENFKLMMYSSFAYTDDMTEVVTSRMVYLVCLACYNKKKMIIGE